MARAYKNPPPKDLYPTSLLWIILELPLGLGSVLFGADFLLGAVSKQGGSSTEWWG